MQTNRCSDGVIRACLTNERFEVGRRELETTHKGLIQGRGIGIGAEEAGLKLGAVAQPLRAALTGKTTSPPIFDVLAVLGKEESLARLRDQSVVEPARI